MKKKEEKKIRTRFAPSPSGIMHLGNARAALTSYLLAKKHKGSFVLRIEDTDEKKSTQESETSINQILKWLHIKQDEGVAEGGFYGPYKQSERIDIYQEALSKLTNLNLAYRCFCSKEKLEEARQAQIKAKNPPRYNRACLGMSEARINKKLEFKIPFVWRFKVNHDQQITINDLAKGPVVFNMKNFTDFPITRQDGSFTFIFSNFVDDLTMKISHVIRGCDHLSNSALQSALYGAFQTATPWFWHLPMICDENGNKLSKRSKSFNVEDLKSQGFLPEAINNYLVIIGKSLEGEILDEKELTEIIDQKIASQDHVKFDMQKLMWLNQQWIQKLNTQELIKNLKNIGRISQDKNPIFLKALEVIKKNCKTLIELFNQINSVTKDPVFIEIPDEATNLNNAEINDLIFIINKAKSAKVVFSKIKELSTKTGQPLKNFLIFIRYACTKQIKGLSIAEIFEVFEIENIIERISTLQESLKK